MSPSESKLCDATIALAGDATSALAVITFTAARKPAFAAQSPVRSAPGPSLIFLTIALMRAADIVLLLLSAGLANWACLGLDVQGGSDGRVGGMLLATLAAVFVLHEFQAYALHRLPNIHFRLRTIALAVVCGGLAGAVGLLMVPQISEAMRLRVLFWTIASAVLVGGTALITARIARVMTNARRLAQRVAIIGTGHSAATVVALMDSDTVKSSRLVGLYDDNGDPSDDFSAAASVGSIHALIARSRRERIEAIVLVLPLSDPDRIRRACLALGSIAAEIYIDSELFDFVYGTAEVTRLGNVPMIKISNRPLTDWQMVLKGAIDRLLAAVLVLLLGPMLLLIGVAIRMDSPGPVLFRQPRLGLNSALFDIFKFRSMYHHLSDVDADRQATRGDVRITRVGRILRKFSIDELPQLLNVLRGGMSLVGPRPHAPNTRAGRQLFHDAVADYNLRHRVKPGITGWAQVNGWRGETRTREQLEQRIAHDLYYIDNWSLIFDLKILILTNARELVSDVAFQWSL